MSGVQCKMCFIKNVNTCKCCLSKVKFILHDFDCIVHFPLNCGAHYRDRTHYFPCINLQIIRHPILLVLMRFYFSTVVNL